MTPDGAVRDGGFTLIELVVSLALLAAALVAFASIFSDATDQSARADAELAATTIAESLLARMGTEWAMVPGERVGTLDQGYTWRITVALAGDGSSTIGRPVHLYRVDVQVAWTETWRNRSIDLATLRLAAGG